MSKTIKLDQISCMIINIIIEYVKYRSQRGRKQEIQSYKKKMIINKK